ncbi:MAG: NADH-quinone oxidoreductase subunit NuoF [Phycisphaeraceae bacterium]|nr:NADH-quinone oxidoreductase subunit NuoF [Phycisphaeraceae bacterium]
MDEPILCKRIPTPPWGDVAERRTIDYDRYVKTGGYDALEEARSMEPSDIVSMVKDSQLRGRGGAGFSCGLKWSFLPEPDGDRRYLAVNADESEPGTFKDRLLIDFDPHLMLEGIAIACWATQSDTAYIYIRGEYHSQAKVLQKAIDEAYEKKLFGPGSRLGKVNGRDLNCYVHRGAGAYICGEETGLLESLEGKRGWPRIKPPFPAIKGLFGRPTVINNVETLAMLPAILTHGAEWFRSIGTHSHFGENAPGSYGPKLFGVSGKVNRPGVYEDELGIPMSELIEKYCGGIKNGKKYKAAIPGGVSMGFLGTDQYDAELDFDIGRRFNVLGLGTAGVIVMDEDDDIVAMTRNIVRFFSHESCGQCTPCREGSGWLYQMLCRIEDGDGRTKDLDLMDELARSMGAMPGTTICGLADGTNWAVKTALAKFRNEFEARCKPSMVQVGGLAAGS